MRWDLVVNGKIALSRKVVGHNGAPAKQSTGESDGESTFSGHVLESLSFSCCHFELCEYCEPKVKQILQL